MGIAMYFLREILLKVFASGQPDVRSGTSMTTRWVVSANMDSGYPGNQNCMTKHGSSYPQIVYWLGVSVVWNYPRGWAYLKCSRSSRNWWSSSFLSARQIAQKRKLSKTFHTKKNTSQYPRWGEIIRDSPGLKDSALSWRIGVRFFDSGEICQLRMHTVTCLASHNLGKQHRTSNEPQNRIKWPWIEPRLHRKSNNNLTFTKVKYISISMPIFLRVNNYMKSFIQSL